MPIDPTTTRAGSDDPSSQYYLQGLNKDGSEWDRLDELHHGIEAYMGQSLSMAEIVAPKKILDMGAGSGAWAIQAANLYPDATVVATDIAPLPPRPLPKNLIYLHLDALKPYNLPAESFDVIHMRLVLFHLPKAAIASILQRTIDLLKPCGWLLIEDFGRHTGHENSPGPAQATVERLFLGLLQAKGLDPHIGEHLEMHLRSTDAFSNINIKREQLILSTDQGATDESSPGKRAFSNALRRSIEKITRDGGGPEMEAAGLTRELKEAWLLERSDPSFKTYFDFWFTWSCKNS